MWIKVDVTMIEF